MNIRSIGWGVVYDRDYRFHADLEKGEYLFILARTNIFYVIDGEKIFMPENTMIIYDDSISAEYSAVDDYLLCDWICFDAKGDAEFLELAENEFNTPSICPDSEFVSRLVQNIMAEFYSMNSRRIKMLDAMMKTLLMKAAGSGMRRNSIQSSAEPHYSSLIELREKIYRNPQKKWNVDLMAAEVNMSRSYFQHVYRDAFGVSCMTDVISGKIEKAKEILSETGCTVSQVAAMCGYDNEEHFMRQFKKIVGVTPTGYRKKI